MRGACSDAMRSRDQGPLHGQSYLALRLGRHFDFMRFLVWVFSLVIYTNLKLEGFDINVDCPYISVMKGTLPQQLESDNNRPGQRPSSRARNYRLAFPLDVNMSVLEGGNRYFSPVVFEWCTDDDSTGARDTGAARNK